MNYNFHKHKGYGTKAHIEAKKVWRSDIHRFSFKLKDFGETEFLKVVIKDFIFSC